MSASRKKLGSIDIGTGARIDIVVDNKFDVLPKLIEQLSLAGLRGAA